MKTIFTIVFVLLVFTTLPQAQMQLGLKAGLNIASVGGADADQILEGQKLDSKTGFEGGLFFMYQFHKMFAIQPEAYYSMKGATYSQNGGELTLTLDYIEVPLLFKLIIPLEGSKLRPAIFVGPSIGFNSTANAKVVVDGQTVFDTDQKDNTTSTEYCLVFGGGLGYEVGNNEVGVEIRYILGLNTWDDESDPLDVKNNVLNFNAYFGFSLQ